MEWESGEMTIENVLFVLDSFEDDWSKRRYEAIKERDEVKKRLKELNDYIEKMRFLCSKHDKVTETIRNRIRQGKRPIIDEIKS